MNIVTSFGVMGESSSSGGSAFYVDFNSSSSEYEGASTTHIESYLTAENRLTITTLVALNVDGGILTGPGE